MKNFLFHNLSYLLRTTSFSRYFSFFGNFRHSNWFNPIPGGLMQICITLYIFFNTVKAQMCTHSKLLDFYYIHIWHLFAKFHASRWLHSKFKAILGWSVAPRIKFLSKSLKTEYAINQETCFTYTQILTKKPFCQ